MILHIGDIGTVIRVTITENGSPLNVAGASTKEIVLFKPSGAVVVKAAAFTTNGADGQIQYTTLAGDLDDVGVWYVQARVVLGAGTWTTDRGPVEVRR